MTILMWYIAIATFFMAWGSSDLSPRHDVDEKSKIWVPIVFGLIWPITLILMIVIVASGRYEE